MGYNLGPFYFPTKAAIRSYVQEFIKGRPCPSEIDEADKGAWALLSELFARHTDRVSKLEGNYVIAFLVKGHPMGHKELWIRRSDDVEKSFSWNGCITGNEQSVSSLITDALRASIRPPRVEANMACALCGTSSRYLEMDHRSPTFKEIREKFRWIVDPKDLYQDDHTHRWHLRPDRPVAEAWQEHHDSWATWQPLCRQCHLEKTKAQRQQEKALQALAKENNKNNG